MNKWDGRKPEMSVVIVTPDRYDTIRETVRHLRQQAGVERLELIVVAPSVEQLALDEAEVENFAGCRVVEVGAERVMAKARAEGIRHSSASVVVLAEDHSFPQPGWAEALLAAHQHPWAAVGPAIENANPGSAVSWGDLLIAYGRWIHPVAAGVIDDLPGHNSSYKRSVLMDYGPDLPTMLSAETVLHHDLQQKGYQLYLEPAARTAHQNFGRLGSWYMAQFLSGRTFAATRSQRWSVVKRLLYAGGSPLIPLVRLWRILRELLRPGRPHHVALTVMPALLSALYVDAAGQLLGYVAGFGKVREKLQRFESHRYLHTRTYTDR